MHNEGVDYLLGRFGAILDVMADARDIVDGRVGEAVVPAWCASRGWDSYLLGLSARDLAECETTGPARWFADASSAPASLRDLARRVTVSVAVPDLGSRTLEDQLRMTSVRERKRIQVFALVAALRQIAQRKARVVDVGCGAGHLTRTVAERWGRGALGVERNHDLIEQARTLAELANVQFQELDVFQGELKLEPDDFVVGLHACGEVADVALQAAVSANASVAFVSCCLQKLRGDTRVPLSRLGEARGLAMGRDVLGLSNLSSRQQGVEVSLEETMGARRVRHALRLLLQSRGLQLEPGDEMRGLNRRRARHGLESIAPDALSMRGLPPATPAELHECEHRAREQFEVIRRLSLPRNLLARLVECAIVMDRAAFLRENGYEVAVATVFDEEVSPRNLVVVGEGTGAIH